METPVPLAPLPPSLPGLHEGQQLVQQQGRGLHTEVQDLTSEKTQGQGRCRLLSGHFHWSLEPRNHGKWLRHCGPLLHVRNRVLGEGIRG